MKFKINEASNPSAGSFDGLISSIKKFTDQNEHTKALLRLSDFLPNKMYTKILTNINEINVLEGNTPKGIHDYLNEIRKNLEKQLKNEHPDRYKEVMQLF